MQTSDHNPSAQIEKQILESASVSYWLRSTFELALRRDPLDALQDAELLAVALRTRALHAYTVGAPFDAQLTTVVLQEHADALNRLSKLEMTGATPSERTKLKEELCGLVVHIHDVVRTIVAAAQDPGAHPAAGDRLDNLH